MASGMSHLRVTYKCRNAIGKKVRQHTVDWYGKKSNFSEPTFIAELEKQGFSDVEVKDVFLAPKKRGARKS